MGIVDVAKESYVDSQDKKVGIPVVIDNADRAAQFPAPLLNQRVDNLSSKSIELFDGANWIIERRGYPILVGEVGVVDFSYPYEDARRFGVVGDDATNNSGALANNAAISNKIRLPFATNKYRLSTLPALGTATIFGEKFDAFSGPGFPSIEALHAILSESGYFGGIPIGPDARNLKLELIAGVLRQDAVDRTKWFWINAPSQHVPIGVQQVYNVPVGNLVAAGASLVVFYGKVYNRAIALLVVPDETLSNQWGLSVGASVGLDKATIKASINRIISGSVRYDGAAWVALDDSGQDGNLVPSYVSGTLTIAHDFCPGSAVVLSGWSNAGAIIPYRPVIKTVTATNLTVNFVKQDGTFAVGAETTNMAVRFSKSYCGGVNMDGTAGHNAVPFDIGNLWVLGIMEVA